MKQHVRFPATAIDLCLQSRFVLKNQFDSIFYLIKVGLLFFLLFFAGRAQAQCDTFYNADLANPLLHATPAPQSITGLQFVDINGDGLLDCYTVAYNAFLQLYLNVGSAKRPEYKLSSSTGFENITLPVYSIHAFAFADMDGDGDKDFIVDDVDYRQTGLGYHIVRYITNIGSSHQPLFADVNGPNPVSFVNKNPFNGYQYFTFTDIDGDGDIDFYYTGQLNGDQVGYIYLNNSTTAVPYFTEYARVNSSYLYPYRSFYDFNKDGLPDCINHDGGSNWVYLPNTGTITAPHFQSDYSGKGPFFERVSPYQIVDLNSDGAPEAFNYSGHYTTVAPVAVIKQNWISIGNIKIEKLTASQKSSTYKYSWEYNGKMVADYHKPYLYALKKGKYVLYIKDSCGTGVSLPYNTNNNTLIAGTELTSDELTALESKMPLNFSIKAYPNPFISGFVLQLPATNKSVSSTIKITDLAGRAVQTQSTTASVVQMGKALPAGTYFLQVWQNNQEVYHTKVMKR